MSKLLNDAVRRIRDHRSVAEGCCSEDSGQSLIELAMVLPVFFMFMIGFINFCMIMFGLCNISYACRQANRYVCVHSNTSLLPATQSNVDSIVAPYIFLYPKNTYVDTLSYGLGGNVVGGTVTVNVTVTYSVGILFIRLPSVVLSSTASSIIVQ